MTVKSRTIDNLGPQANIDFAKREAFFEPRYIEESRLIPDKTTIAFTEPSTLSEFDQKFSSAKTLVFALFSPPPESPSSRQAIFSYQLAPSLGGYEKMETILEKLENAGTMNLESSSEKLETDRKTLLSFTECLMQLDKLVERVDSERRRLQKG